MKYIYFIFLFSLSCTPKNPELKTTENAVTVKTETYNSRSETYYSVTDGNCKIAWQTTWTNQDQNIDVQLINRTQCDKPFQQVIKLHDQVIDRLLKDHKPASIKNLMTGGLKTLQPDGSWNVAIVNASRDSKEYLDFRNNYPKHASGKSSNQIFAELVKQTQPHADFKQMLASHGLNFELSSVEKVFTTKDEQGKTVLEDAGSLWWSSI